MPHRHSEVGSDDLASSDEIKVFEDEGEDEEKRGEHLTDEKSSLITDSEQVQFTVGDVSLIAISQEKSSTSVDGQYASSSKHNGDIARSDNSVTLIGKPLEPLWHSPLGYGIVPSFHSNGSSMTNKVTAMVGGPHPSSPLSFMMHNIEFRQPPPAHMGIHYDAKTGIPRPPMYPLSTGQYSHSVFPELTQWHSSAMYPMTTSAFRGPYLPNLTGSSFANFSPPSLIPSHGLGGHPSLQQLASSNQKHQDLVSAVASGMNPLNQGHHHESLNGLSSRSCLPTYPHNSTSRNAGSKSSVNRVNSGGSGGVSVSSPSSANHSISSPSTTDTNKHSSGQNHHNNNSNTHKYNHSSNAHNKHIKKPLNAFMLYMKDKRSQVVSECTLKESAAINQILGKRWHSLPREEQAKYYDLARKERQMHLEMYPGWTAKDNYAINQKKKKKKRDKSTDGEGGSLKKCRARFGLDNQTRWCKPCRRKKKCVRFSDGNDTTNESEDNVNSVETIEAPTPDSKSATETDSDTLNVSPLGLSLSSPSVPSSEYILPHISNTLSQSLSSQSELTPRSQSSSSSSTLASLSCPPRNSPIGPNNPLSIEQLTRPHCPLSRSSAPSTPNIFITTSCVVSSCVATQRS